MPLAQLNLRSKENSIAERITRNEKNGWIMIRICKVSLTCSSEKLNDGEAQRQDTATNIIQQHGCNYCKVRNIRTPIIGYPLGLLQNILFKNRILPDQMIPTVRLTVFIFEKLVKGALYVKKSSILGQQITLKPISSQFGLCTLNRQLKM